MNTQKTTQKVNNQKFNMSLIMRRAWKIFKAENKKNNNFTFSQALKKSWAIAKDKKHNLSFNKIYVDHYNNIFSFIKMKTNNIEVAEEIVQDVFVKVFENLDLYDPNKSKLNTWLYTISNNSITDFYRKNAIAKKPVQIDSFVNEEGKETFEIGSNFNISGVEQDDLKTSINNAFKKLNKKEQQIANFYFLEQKKYNEVAQYLNITLGTVKGTINRIRAKLQKQLQNEYTML
ncbi:MAG: sigma-70 family RNA polymerase sigma factor [Patescibacteria group bacterium]|nr:sigma-70 family RNA polymerase sigma factor [Patescibacteria group bacterium]